MKIVLRAETPADGAAIDALTRAAFLQAPHSSHTEHLIVAALRRAGALSVSLVAEAEGELVGHVALSPVYIGDGTQGWYGLGPISVAPALQRRGIGAQLMQGALAALREMAAGGCVLLGDPDYYQRFGFRPQAELVLPGVPPEYFQALPLSGSLPHGEVRYHAAFEVGG